MSPPDDPCYDLTKRASKGVCYLYNVTTVKDGPTLDSNKSERDIRNLTATFHGIGFDSKIIRNNPTSENVIREVDDISKSIELQMYGCFFFVWVGHGIRNTDMLRLLCADGKTVCPNEIILPFCGKYCRALSDVPKVFVFQITEIDVPTEYSGALLTESEWSTAGTRKVTSYEDTLVCFTTEHGSSFVNHLCAALLEQKTKRDILTIMTHLNGKISKEIKLKSEYGRSYQMPYQISSLSKLLFVMEGDSLRPRGSGTQNAVETSRGKQTAVETRNNSGKQKAGPCLDIFDPQVYKDISEAGKKLIALADINCDNAKGAISSPLRQISESTNKLIRGWKVLPNLDSRPVDKYNFLLYGKDLVERMKEVSRSYKELALSPTAAHKEAARKAGRMLLHSVQHIGKMVQAFVAPEESM